MELPWKRVYSYRVVGSASVREAMRSRWVWRFRAKEALGFSYTGVFGLNIVCELREGGHGYFLFFRARG